MKTLKFNKIHLTFCIFSLCSIFACSEDESCEYVETSNPCVSLPPNNVVSNKTVVTFFPPNLENARVGAIYETQNNFGVEGTDWGNTILATYPSNWTILDIGAIFGIAIDDSQNIYLASSDVYHYHMGGFPSSNLTRPFGAGQIFKCSPPSYNAVPFVNLPNFGDSGNGIGNLAYDKKNQQLFATNLENGLIYRISLAGSILETYDPWDPDSGIVDGFSKESERIWAIGVNYENGNVKVYFPRVSTSTGVSVRELYSITLNQNGEFPANGSEIVEIFNLPGSQNEITDIAFSSSTNEMLLSERGNPHKSTVHSFNRMVNGWILNKFYFIGSNLPTGENGLNSAGGVDFFNRTHENGTSECDNYFWASGNYMGAQSVTGKLYGIQGINYNGNNSFTDLNNPNQVTDLFIDFDGVYSTQFKGGVGDVEVFDSNNCFDLCL